MPIQDVSSPEQFPGISAARAGNETTNVDQDNYDLDAELQFSGGELLLTSTVRSCPELRFEFGFVGTAPSDVQQLYVSARGDSFDRIPDALRDDPTVREAKRVVEFNSEVVYQIRPVMGAARVLPEINAVDGYVREVYSDSDGWTVRMYLPTRTALSDLNDRCSDIGVDISVSHLADLETATETPDCTLTTKQRELLIMASREGYFEVPRQISQRELAESFGVSPSAVSQQLRTAIGNLAAATFGTN